ncbi:MAG: ABC transporter permease [Planctomycetota bacterium]|nr:ABC transporter permease [Planctomycetota bacterium]
MSNSLHIAAREYSENARTKGFWINLLMFPVILFLSIKVPQLLEDKAKPARHFVLIDQSGSFEGVIDQAMERSYQGSVMKKLGEYIQKYTKEEFRVSLSAKALEDMPQVDMKVDPANPQGAMFDMVLNENPEVLDDLSQEGGLDMVVQLIAGRLVEERPDFEPPKRFLVHAPIPDGALEGVDLTSASREDIVAGIKPYLLNEKSIEGSDAPLFALVVIPPDAFQQVRRPGEMSVDALADAKAGVQFWSTNLTDMDLANTIEGAINREVQRLEFESKDLDPDAVAAVQRTEMQFAAFDPNKKVGEEIVSMADTIRKWAPVGFVYLLWVAIFTVVNMLLNNTVEEKSNRIIEVLLSSATPWEIMSGKLIGIAGVGLTMMVGWFVSLLGVLHYMAGPEVEWAGVLIQVIQTGGLLPLFGLYFFSGYMIYAGIFLAIGSLCNTVKEAQNFMGTATIILMVPLFTMVFIAQDPHGSLATFLTWVPLYTPFVMMNRAAADPPMFDLVGSGILMFCTAIFMLWLSSRIFRMGVLRTGQPPKFIELIRSLKASQKNM